MPVRLLSGVDAREFKTDPKTHCPRSAIYQFESAPFLMSFSSQYDKLNFVRRAFVW